MNTEKENLECVHPFDAFAAMHHGLNWVVDWGTGLTDAERQFVRDNLWNFCAAYQDWGDDTERHDFELTALEEQVLSLSEQGDAALEAGDALAAMDFYQKAKDVRANALFGSKEDFPQRPPGNRWCCQWGWRRQQGAYSSIRSAEQFKSDFHGNKAPEHHHLDTVATARA